jgi:hypothetical protein
MRVRQGVSSILRQVALALTDTSRTPALARAGVSPQLTSSIFLFHARARWRVLLGIEGASLYRQRMALPSASATARPATGWKRAANATRRPEYPYPDAIPTYRPQYESFVNLSARTRKL